MKLQLLTLVSIVITANALPALKIAGLHEKYQPPVDKCTSGSFGYRCMVVNVRSKTTMCWSDLVFHTLANILTGPWCSGLRHLRGKLYLPFNNSQGNCSANG